MQRHTRLYLLGAAFLAMPATLQAQPWVVWESDDVDSRCGVINTPTLEFVVRDCDQALVLVTGEDLGFVNTIVTDEGEVFIDDVFAGYVSFEEDADGFFTLWWVDEDGFAIDFDDVTFEPFETADLPADYLNVPCSVDDDALEVGGLWQGDADCDQPAGGELMEPLLLGGNGGAGGGPTGTCGIGSLGATMLACMGLMLLSRRR